MAHTFASIQELFKLWAKRKGYRLTSTPAVPVGAGVWLVAVHRKGSQTSHLVKVTHRELVSSQN